MELQIWPGWLGGIAIGIFTAGMLWLTGRVLGMSSAYGEACGLLGDAYFRAKERGFGQSWRLWMAAGLPIGGAVAVLTSGADWAPVTTMGALYESVLPQSMALRAIVLIGGGVCIGFGSRMAGGCQSGHSIAGIALLNPPSIVASIGFFIGGVVMVQALFAFAA